MNKEMNRWISRFMSQLRDSESEFWYATGVVGILLITSLAMLAFIYIVNHGI